MKTMYRSAFIALIAMVLFSSCKSKVSKQATLIPKDAMVVFVMDQDGMSEKLKKGNFKLDESIEKLFVTIDSIKGKKMLTDAKNAGVDFKEKMFGFITQKGNPKTTQITSANLIATLTDASKFETFIKAQDLFKGRDVKKGTNYSYIQLDGNGMISWTSDLAMVTGFMVNQTGSFDNVTGTYKEPAAINKVEELKKLVESFYTLKDADKVSSVKAFSDMMNEKADAYIFASTTSTTNTLSMLPFQLPKLEELMKDNYSTGLINFEDGKITSTGTYYFNDRLNSLMKQYGSSSVKPSVLENFPTQNMNAALLMSFKPEMVGGIVKELELETLANIGLSQVGITMQDIYKCLKGDIAFAMGDFAMTPSGGLLGVQPSMKYLMAAEVGDKASLDKVLAKAVEMKVLENNGGIYTLNKAMPSPMVYVRIDTKNIFVTSDEATYTQYAAKTLKSNLNKDFTGKLNGKTMAMYVNINSFLNAFAPMASSNEHGKVVMNKALSTFNDAYMFADNVTDGKLKSSAEFTMKDAKQNSLVSLADFAKTAFEEIKKVDAERKARYQDYQIPQMDTTLLPPPPPSHP
jgi:hypothetical protein